MVFKQATWRSISYLLLIALFSICATFVIIYATGYQIDLGGRNLKQTALLNVQTELEQAEIYLDGQAVGQGGVVLRNLEPASYLLEVKYPEFTSWSKKITLKAGEAISIGKIVLFRQKPTAEEFNGEISAAKLPGLADLEDLTATGGEIRQNGALISRFTSDPQGVCWYPDRQHVAFTQDNILKIITVDGTGLVELLEKKSSSPVLFLNSGRVVVFESDGKIYRAQIR